MNESEATLKGADEGGSQLAGTVLFLSSLFSFISKSFLIHELLRKLGMG